MSQPTVYEVSKLSRTRTYPFTIKSRHVGITSTERDAKIAELKKYIESNIGINEEQVEEGEQIAEEATIQDDSGNKAKFFYFIGRLNPPHSGHLKALETLVKMANEQGSEPLILLGSGPGSKRTMDNPISFELKQNFISRVLNEKMPRSRYKIEKMTNPARDVSNYIKEGLGENLDKIEQIEIKHIAGGKDEDTTKLLFALKSAEKTARNLASEAEIITAVEPIEAETIEGKTPMSATQVRKDAYRTFLNGTGFDGWPQEYKDFYGQDSESMYNEILFPLQSSEVRTEDIENYLNPKKRKLRKGGTKRKGRKYRKKTKKRRRRTSRYKH